jgi:hypothetical protein
MPEWVLVGENDRGETAVVCNWMLGLGLSPVDAVKRDPPQLAVFKTRWDAKRVIRRRNEWRNLRCVRRDRL